MTKRFMIVLINKRKKEAVTVQKILTEWGCLIRARLGLHEGVLDNCTETGSIFLELAGEEEKLDELNRKLNLLNGVSAELIKMEVD